MLRLCGEKEGGWSLSSKTSSTDGCLVTRGLADEEVDDFFAGIGFFGAVVVGAIVIFFFVTRGPTFFFFVMMTGSLLSSIGALRFQEAVGAGGVDILTGLHLDRRPFIKFVIGVVTFHY